MTAGTRLTHSRSFRYVAGLLPVAALAFAGALAATAQDANAAESPAKASYQVTIVNLTKGQPLSPPVLATHVGRGLLFSPGKPAIYGVQQIAENGNADSLEASLKQDEADGYVSDYFRAGQPLVPKSSPASARFSDRITFQIDGKPGDRISWVSMLGCTNDGFAGFDAGALPRKVNRSVNVIVRDFDAGTEENTEDFEDLTAGCQGAIGVKSQFGATGTSATDWRLAENGVVHRHEGIFGTSDDGLVPDVHDWNPRQVAKVSIRRIA